MIPREFGTPEGAPTRRSGEPLQPASPSGPVSLSPTYVNLKEPRTVPRHHDQSRHAQRTPRAELAVLRSHFEGAVASRGRREGRQQRRQRGPSS